eukprot:gene7039-biopygen4311
MIRSYRFFLAYRFPALDIFSNGDYLTWRSDQSVVGVMSWEMITWSFQRRGVTVRGRGSRSRLTPYNLRPGLVGFDYEQNFTITFIYGKRNYVNGEWFNESEMEKSVGRFYERLLNTYLEEPRKAQSMWALSPSPSGVPLAPVAVTGDVRVNVGNYEDRPLDGSEGAIDISLPYASGTPVGGTSTASTSASTKPR